MLKIALDAMGGDHAPGEIVAGAVEALAHYPDIEKIYLVGKADVLTAMPETRHERLAIVSASEVIEMDDHPASAYRRKKDASITVATKLVKDGAADAVVSAGSTGGQMVAALFGLGRIKGISRPAIGCIIPTAQGGKLVADVGANTKIDGENLVQFAQMGSIYMSAVMGIEQPTVGLVNNGTEETKGSELTQAAYQLLKTAEGINFAGNIEGRDIPAGTVDIMVCDGFTGNVILKTMEGMGKTIIQMLQEEVMASTRSKAGALLMKPALKALKERMDYAAYGGAPLLGVDGISVVCHGSSKAKAIRNGIRVACECVEGQFIQQLKAHVESASAAE